MKNKPDITYPIKWQYRLIGENEENIKFAVTEIIKNQSYSLNLSQKSAKKKYLSLILEVEVKSENERISIHRELDAQPAIKIII